ncbi:hypothetical protein JTE90_027669 [Oedothorax gibbosus]|uniref:C2H2-type domain-containing protein n=1 Tax=Oedothorax gibbosus TaxID=931172 RepID=A0AAV6UP93_9ARAC|nr:hypothetical protein JTE90_027669 [Oedothorax gibbosus]
MESVDMIDVSNVSHFEEVELLQSWVKDNGIENAVAHMTEGGNTNIESLSETQTVQETTSHKDADSSTSTAIQVLKRKRRNDRLDDNGMSKPSSSQLDTTTSNPLNSGITLEGLKEEYEGTPERVTSEIPDCLEIDFLTCPYCFKKYSSQKSKNHHIITLHNVKPKVTRGNYIKCVECNISFKNTSRLRNHLRSKHDMKMDMQELNFPNMEAFKKWKNFVERKELMKYVTCQTYKTSYGYKHTYGCHRSGRYVARIEGGRKRRIRSDGSVKMGIMCSAGIICREYKDDVVEVMFFPYHYGHGKETSYRQLTQVEINAIQENVSKGVDYDDILGDMHEDSASFAASMIRQKDTKVILKAFASEEYNSDLSDAEGVDRWVRICSQMEDSPVLYYRQDDEQFILIIMTEFQKNILLTSDKRILCVDTDHKKRTSRFYLISLMALDECEVAFPVAFCISNKVDKGVIRQFLLSVREASGPLSCEFFMSDSDSFYLESWQEVMEDNPKWLWSKWWVDMDFVRLLKPLKGLADYRADFYKMWKLLLECKNTEVFMTMFKNFAKRVCDNPVIQKGADTVLKKYGPNKMLWGYCFHKDIKLSCVMQFEVLHRTMIFSSVRGRKSRLDKFIIVLLKLMKFKLLYRLTGMLDEEKTSLAVESINAFHKKGFQICSESISSLGDTIWMIISDDEEGNVYVAREFDSCPERCDLKCSECDICVHMYSCTCMRNTVYADLCPHIHAVVWKFLTPHFSPLPSPVHDNDNCEDSNDASHTCDQPSEPVNVVMSMTHSLFKKIRSNKSTLSDAVLSAMKYRINELMDMCSKNEVIDTQLNSNNVQAGDVRSDSNDMEANNSHVNSNNVQLNPNIVLNTDSTNIVPQTVRVVQPQIIRTNQTANPTPPYFLILPSNLNLGYFVKPDLK